MPHAECNRQNGCHHTTPGIVEINCECGTVRECIEYLSENHPESRSRLFDEHGEVSSVLMIFLNGENVRHLDGLATPVKEGDQVAIIPLAAGG